jgi:hypothetical protein
LYDIAGFVGFGVAGLNLDLAVGVTDPGLSLVGEMRSLELLKELGGEEAGRIGLGSLEA